MKAIYSIQHEERNFGKACELHFNRRALLFMLSVHGRLYFMARPFGIR